jgi:membrane associated rhomboid family serine protease
VLYHLSYRPAERHIEAAKRTGLPSCLSKALAPLASAARMNYTDPMQGALWQRLRWRTGIPACTLALLVLTVVVFLVQALSRALLGISLVQLLGLSVAGMLRGQVWQLLTYLLLHGNLLHLLLNMWMLGFLGSEVERTIGPRHFLVVYLLAGVLGGAGWLYLTYPYEGVCVGASGALFGLLSAYATLFPRREITFLLFLIFPVTLRAWVLALGLGVVQWLFMQSPEAGGVAYSAHLAGGVVGFVYTLLVFRPEVVREGHGRWRERRRMRVLEQQTRQQSEDRLETDRILDKMAAQGVGSLTEAERKRLEKASSRLRGSHR